MKALRISTIACMLFLSSAVAFAQQGNGQMQGRRHGPPISAEICTDGQYLFVMAGDTLFQYAVADLTLVATIDLPRPEPPEETADQSQGSVVLTGWAEKLAALRGQAGTENRTQPPPPRAGSGLCTDGTYLFMLRGPEIQQYSVSDMTLVNSVQLPSPETQETD